MDFVGTYSPVTYSTENHSVLFLGGNSTLYYPDGTAATTINACRAYFQLKNGLTAGDKTNAVRAFKLNFGDEGSTQGVTAPLSNQSGAGGEAAGAWYDLQGRRLESSIFNSQSSIRKKGLYINGNRKVVVK